MRTSSIIWIIVIVIVIVVLGFWYWSSTSGQSPNAAEMASSSSLGAGAPMIPAVTVVLNAASTTQLGAYLVADNGMTLYKYADDQPDVSNCSGQCAVIWPPYTISAVEASTSLMGGSGVMGSIGTITRADGTLQVTYDATPLYFYDKDTTVGDTTGQDVGGTWFVVSP